jgi:hypothetical protein
MSFWMMSIAAVSLVGIGVYLYASWRMDNDVD